VRILQELDMLSEIDEGLRLHAELFSLTPDGSKGVSEIWWEAFMKRLVGIDCPFRNSHCMCEGC
jgi:hypothetical protein